MPRRLALTLLIAVLAATACGSSPVAFDRPAVGPLCGWREAPPSTYKHVVWLLQENTSESDVIGNGGLPFVNQTLVPQCGVATNDHNVSHGSLPNYLGLTSGGGGGSREAGNCQPVDCPQTQPNLFEQLQASGRTWGEYALSMTGNCDPTKDSQYEPEHAVPSATDPCTVRSVAPVVARQFQSTRYYDNGQTRQSLITGHAGVNAQETGTGQSRV